MSEEMPPIYVLELRYDDGSTYFLSREDAEIIGWSLRIESALKYYSRYDAYMCFKRLVTDDDRVERLPMIKKLDASDDPIISAVQDLINV